MAGVIALDRHLSAGEAELATCFAKPALVVWGEVSSVFVFSNGIAGLAQLWSLWDCRYR